MNRFDPLDFDIFGLELLESLEMPHERPAGTTAIQNELNNYKNLGGKANFSNNLSFSVQTASPNSSI